MLNQNQLDTEALHVAIEAKQSVSTHEKVCIERYKNVDEKLEEIKKNIENIYGRLWIAAGSIITILLSILIGIIFIYIKGNAT